MSEVNISWDVFVRGVLPFSAAIIYLLTLAYFTLVRHKIRAYPYFAIFMLSFSLFLFGPMVNLLPFSDIHRYFDVFRNILLFSVGIPSLTIGLCLVADRRVTFTLRYLPFFLGMLWSLYFIASPPLNNMVFQQNIWLYTAISPQNVYVSQAILVVSVLLLPTLVVIYGLRKKVPVHNELNKLKMLCFSIVWLCFCMCAGLIHQHWGVYYGGASITALIWAWAVYQDIYRHQLVLNKYHLHQNILAKNQFSLKNMGNIDSICSNQLSDTYPYRERGAFVEAVFLAKIEQIETAHEVFTQDLKILTKGKLDFYRTCAKETLFLIVDETIYRGADPNHMLKRLISSGKDIDMSASTSEIDSYLLTFAVSLSTSVFEMAKESSEKILVDQIKIYILANYHKNIGLDQIAEDVGTSRAKATKVFKLVEKITINQYLTEIRMERAKSLILLNSVTETALDVGFSNPSYFTTVFKKYTGSSPSEYKAKMSIHRNA